MILSTVSKNSSGTFFMLFDLYSIIPLFYISVSAALSDSGKVPSGIRRHLFGLFGCKGECTAYGRDEVGYFNFTGFPQRDGRPDDIPHIAGHLRRKFNGRQDGTEAFDFIEALTDDLTTGVGEEMGAGTHFLGIHYLSLS
ncbi:MAG: hypothetical protein WC477_06970 [Patescibacteria group bacterium]